jgi:hypothetical protein
MTGMYFETLDLAIEHAKQHGGWIVNRPNAQPIWFDAQKGWTLGKILVEVKGDYEVGPWTNDFTRFS